MQTAKLLGQLDDKYGTQAKERQRTFAELVVEYRSARVIEVETGERAASQWEREKRIVRRLETAFGELTLDQVDRDAVLGFKFTRRADTKSGSGEQTERIKGATVNRDIAALSAVLQLAVDRGWLHENPARGVGRYPEKPDWTWLHPEEADALLAACQHPKAPPYLYPLVLAAIYTGMRAGELLNLEWRDVDLRGRTILLEVTKTGRRRLIPLRQEVVDVLRRWKDTHPGPFVIAKHDGTPFKQVPLCFKTALKRAGLRRPGRTICFRDLRHTAASWMAQNGGDLLQIKRVLGHTTIATTQRYAHLVQRNDELAVEAMPGLDELSEAPEVAKAATKTATRPLVGPPNSANGVPDNVTPLPRKPSNDAG